MISGSGNLVPIPTSGLFHMQVLTIIVIVLHVIVSLALIGLILLHSGRGGGLSDMFGGGMGPGGGVGGASRCSWASPSRRPPSHSVGCSAEATLPGPILPGRVGVAELADALG